MSAVEVAGGIHRLEEPDGRRRLVQVVVTGADRTLIVDAGLPNSPASGILPLLARLGRTALPTVVLLTHPDADHRGGAPELRDALRQVELWSHDLDADQLCDPERTLRERYLAFARTDGLELEPQRLELMRARLGRPLGLDRRLVGDTRLDLGGRSVELLHTPGHSPGSVVAWLPENGVAVIGDAAMGRGIAKEDGSLMYPPMFSPLSTYLATIERLEGLHPRLVLSGHEPPLAREAAVAFLAVSREAALQLSTLVRTALGAGGSSTLESLCRAVAERYEGLPSTAWPTLAMTVDGILQELVAYGEVKVEVELGPPRRFRSLA